VVRDVLPLPVLCCQADQKTPPIVVSSARHWNTGEKKANH